MTKKTCSSNIFSLLALSHSMMSLYDIIIESLNSANTLRHTNLYWRKKIQAYEENTSATTPFDLSKEL